jgi:hypothetical protein
MVNQNLERQIPPTTPAFGTSWLCSAPEIATMDW